VRHVASWLIDSRRWRVSAWPFLIAAAVRLLIWLALPERLASDESGYYAMGTMLMTTGDRNTFWPPLTGFLIAAVEWLSRSSSIRIVRFGWIVIDLVSVVALRALAMRAAAAMWPAGERSAERFGNAVALAYALYLPAVSYAQFATSETPAMALVLFALLLLVGRDPGWMAFGVAGVLFGAATVTRPNLLPLVVVPAATTAAAHRTRIGRAVASVACGLVVVVVVAFWNWSRIGELTLARNGAYNLYIGNSPFYAEDLNLFHPRATSEQIEFRRQAFEQRLAYPNKTSAELQKDALDWIAAHPLEFCRRALGRLGRVFVPRTDVLELVGGEQTAGIFSGRALGILAVANAEWVLILAGGVVGLVVLLDRVPNLGRLFWSVIAASLLLCLIAISKPRYSFVFDPLLIMGAVLSATEAPTAVLGSIRRHRAFLTLACAFAAWSWIAWTIFALSSRAALAGH
jgi:hypothetical protein